MRVYPVGYSAYGAEKYIDELLQDPDVLIIDTRLKPWSVRPNWQRPELEQKYGKRYHWAGEYLGNLHYKGGLIKLANPEVGIKGLVGYLNKGHDLILVCQCAMFDDCHTKEICRLLVESMPEVEVVKFSFKGEPDTIKCLSVRQPYATWLANPQKFLAENLTPKRIENRNWSTNYRGPILIHASKTFEDGAIECWLNRMPGIRRAVSLDLKDYPLGAIVGKAELSEVITIRDGAKAMNPWFCGEYGFMLKHARPINPIPYRGGLKLFDVPKNVLDQTQKPEQEQTRAESIVICMRTGKSKSSTRTWSKGDKVTASIPYNGDMAAIVRDVRMNGQSQQAQLKTAVYAPLLSKYIVSEDKRWFDGENLKERANIIKELGEKE